MIRFDLILNAQAKTGKVSGSEIIKKYNTYSGTSLPLYSSWCAATISVIMRECKVPTNIVPNFHSCTQFMNWCKQYGIWHERNEANFIPIPSDIILFDWDKSGDADHIGIVTGYDGNIIYTIEGNSNNQCKHKEYKLDNKQIRRYARPNYPPNGYAGIDISTFQKLVNYNLIKSYGINFVILRSSMTYQSSHKQDIDAMLYKHYSGISALNIPIGYYHYSVAINEVIAKSEAEYMVKCIKDKKVDMPLFMDVEDVQLKALGKNKLMSSIKTFKQVIETNGYTFGLYTGKQFTDDNLLDMTWIKQNKIPLWYAQYNTTITSTHKSLVDIWQFNSGGDGADYKVRMPFIGNTGLDVNISYVDPQNICSKKGSITLKSGWIQESGKWHYYENGTKKKNLWIKSQDKKDWYYVKDDATMATDEWLEIKGHWYKFDKDGKTMRGWYHDINKHWFYLNETGNTEFPECAMQTYWKQIIYKGSKSWFYFETESGKNKGHMYTNRFVLSNDGNWYYLGVDGRMQKNRVIIHKGARFSLDRNGVCTNPVPEKMI